MGGFHINIHPIFNAIVAFIMAISTIEMAEHTLRVATLLISLLIAILGLVKAIKNHVNDYVEKPKKKKS